MTESVQTTDLEDLARISGTGKAFGITPEGFVPKPLARLLDEKMAAARVLFGSDVDLTAGSALRKILEIVALEEARTWVHLGLAYEDTRVSTAVGDALSRLGEELGLPRPHHRATGQIRLSLAQDLPADVPQLPLQRGARLLTDGGLEFFVDQDVSLSNAVRQATVPVTALVPGPESDIDPLGSPADRIVGFRPEDPGTALLRQLAERLGAQPVVVEHTTATSGGATYWSDARYRDLLLSYPRNVWSPDAVRLTVALVPGVRQVLVKDLYGGLDINQPIFGSFTFLERLFSQERSLGNPYFFTVLVAPEEGAIWEQLHAQVEAAVDQVRPIGIAPQIDRARQVSVGFTCTISVEGLPIPVGPGATVQAAPEAVALKQRILDRVRRRLLALGIGEPVRYSEVMWAVMEEPGVVDARDLVLRRYPPQLSAGELAAAEPGEDQPGADQPGGSGTVPQALRPLRPLEDVLVGPTEIAQLVGSPDDIRIV
ncbi:MULTISPECIES: baseplate J/gp47 family protein [unclassified Streptomyces]|uniref:baseplate J/gp47 family protein n=1 Tax=unclassified Streptomyces TaxID=2593676 RepID=UPI00225BCA17|nr:MULTISPECIES: baseplate J/gp47 family protein [unclassified Streptomyces]MCX4650254.1 baseplate J/gp47 family protein [Streptomyces sp. NBC_01446]MCX5327749.1 baseplate J/gp47 family protein [Streptomyces sp. NBC_00120]